METLEAIDRAIVIYVNGWNTPFLDAFFWWVSQRITWIPFYAFVLLLAWIKLDRRTFFWMLATTIASIILADLLSVHAFKNVFQRYRPSHHAELTEILHFYRMPNGEFYKGGMYGFVSSHAANFFALAASVSFFLKSKIKLISWLMFSVASLVSFSRLYQGVHYLSDLVAGAVLGVFMAWLIHYFVFLRISRTK